MVFVVCAAFGFDIGLTRVFMKCLDSCSLLRVQAAHVFVIVIGMLPDGAGWVAGGVDEVLVVLLFVVLAHPALGKGTSFVFHATTVLWRNAITDSVG